MVPSPINQGPGWAAGSVKGWKLSLTLLPQGLNPINTPGSPQPHRDQRFFNSLDKLLRFEASWHPSCGAGLNWEEWDGGVGQSFCFLGCLNPHRKSAGSGPVLKTQAQFGLCLRERCLHPAGGQRLSVEPNGAGEGQPGARGENRAGDASSQRGAALSCKGSGAGCLMTSHQLARGAEVFPSRLSRAKINKTRRETALAPRRSREIGRGTTERPPQPGVSVGSSWERGSLLEILLQGSKKGFFWGRAPSVEKRVPQLPLVRNGVKNQEQELGWVPKGSGKGRKFAVVALLSRGLNLINTPGTPQPHRELIPSLKRLIPSLIKEIP